MANHKFVELEMTDGHVMLLNLDNVAVCIRKLDGIRCQIIMSYDDEHGDAVIYDPVYPYAHMKLLLAPDLK
jgi:hypothetical protein